MQVKDPEAIRRARKRKEYTQRDLAALCRCSQAAITNIERGILTNITEDLAKAIAKRLDRDVEDLFIRHANSRAHRVAIAAPPACRKRARSAA